MSTLKLFAKGYLDYDTILNIQNDLSIILMIRITEITKYQKQFYSRKSELTRQVLFDVFTDNKIYS